MGYSSVQCIKIGYSSAQCFKIGYVRQCIRIGYSSGQCIKIGYSSVQCIKIGYSSAQCIKIGIGPKYYRGWGCSQRGGGGVLCQRVYNGSGPSFFGESFCGPAYFITRADSLLRVLPSPGAPLY